MMKTVTADSLVKLFYICAVLYIYIFVMVDVLRLNPESDGLLSLFALLPPISFPVLAVIAYIAFGRKRGQCKVIKILFVGIPLTFFCTLFLTTLLMLLQDPFGWIASAGKSFLWILQPALPLVVYLIYKKLNRNKAFFMISAFVLCAVALCTYPAKNYIEAKMSGDPCATKKLAFRSYNISAPAANTQKVHGDVVCIATDREYPSRTYRWEVFDIADAGTFEYLSSGYSRDKNYVFYEGAPTEADSQTFVLDPKWPTDDAEDPMRTNTRYMRDARYVYFEGERVPTSNINQFTIIDICHSSKCATDGSSIFKNGKIVEGMSPENLNSFHSCEYAKDDEFVYYATEVIPHADVETFDIYGAGQYCYAHDKAHTYYHGKVVSQADPKLLKKVRENDPFSPETDGTHFYYDGVKIDLDINSFEYLGKSVTKDAHSVYYRNKRIVEADPDTFEPVPINSLNMCAKDKHNRYFDGEVSDHPACQW